MKHKITKNNLISIIKRFIFISLIVSLISVNGFSVSQNIILNWEFEEGSGGLVFDNSDNGITGAITGVYRSNYIYKNGLRSVHFVDTRNSFIKTITNFQTPNNYSISFWFLPYDFSNDQSLFSLTNNNQLQELYYSYNDNTFKFRYKDETNREHDLNLWTTSLQTYKWYHIVIIVNNENKSIKFYLNNQLKNISNYNSSIKNNNNNYLILSSENNLSKNLYGNIDSFYIFDFDLNETQISSLYHYNNLSLDNNENFNNDPIKTTNYNLINYTLPLNNSNVTKKLNIEYNLNKVGTCELYIDNNYINVINDKLSGVFKVFIPNNGLHFYQLNCWSIKNQTKYYEVSNKTYLNVITIKRSIDFYLFNHNDSLLLGEDLYIQTPCFRSSFGFYGKQIKDNRKFYIKKINHGWANMVLETDKPHEFCLIRGTINIDNSTKYNTNYDIVEINNLIRLGNITINNNSKTYGFRLDNQDLYKVYEPSFWGRTWENLFNMILAIIFGGLVILLGVYMNQPKIVISGVIIILAGFGIEISKIIGGFF